MSSSRITNKKLAKLITSAQEKSDRSCRVIYDLASHGHERFSEIVERLGSDHPAVTKHSEHSKKLGDLMYEGGTRVGHVSYLYMINYLER